MANQVEALMYVHLRGTSSLEHLISLYRSTDESGGSEEQHWNRPEAFL